MDAIYTLTDRAKEIRRKYCQTWRKKHREYINAYQKQWRARNPNKIKLYIWRYWEKKAQVYR